MTSLKVFRGKSGGQRGRNAKKVGGPRAHHHGNPTVSTSNNVIVTIIFTIDYYTLSLKLKT